MIEPITTERLALRPMTMDDVELLLDLDSDPEVMRYLTGRTSTRGEVEDVVRGNVGHRWVGFLRAGGDFVGWYGAYRFGEAEVEVGYRLKRAFWGLGLATEGTLAVIAAAFDAGATRVFAQTMAVNERSRAVMARCGLRYARTFHLEWDDPLPGTEHGEVEYELTRDEWEVRHVAT